MLDDLRQQADSSFYEEEETPPFDRRAPHRTHFLGMTPLQRFVIALLLFLMACILSSFCLLVTERIVLPFL